MAILGFLKKKEQYLPLPPPPLPPRLPLPMKGDIEEIRPQPIAQPILLEFPPALPAPAEEKEEMVFDKTVVQEEPKPKRVILEEPTIPSTPRQTFVAIEDYRKIISETNSIRERTMNADSFVKKLSDMRADEDKLIDRWRTHLEDAEKKLTYIDNLIAKAEKG